MALAGIAAITGAVCGTGPEVLENRSCSTDAQCVADYRCRLGRCVKCGPEVCDGEDNNCNGIVDDGYYVPSSLQVLSVSLAARQVVSRSGEVTLFGTVVVPGPQGDENRLAIARYGRDGRLLGGQTLSVGLRMRTFRAVATSGG